MKWQRVQQPKKSHPDLPCSYWEYMVEIVLGPMLPLGIASSERVRALWAFSFYA